MFYKKRGQVSIFIILGIIIVIVFAFLFYLRRLRTPEVKLDFNRQSINSYISECIEKTSRDGLILIGLQGGHISPTEFIEAYQYKISIYDNGIEKFPSKQEIEIQLSDYIDNNLMECLKDFKAFRSWEVEYEKPQSTTQLNKEDVLFTTTFPLEVKSGDTSYNYNTFTTAEDVRLSFILDVANEMVNFNYPLLWEYDDFSDTAMSGYDLEIYYMSMNRNHIVSIKDIKSNVDLDPYHFNFALNFSES